MAQTIDRVIGELENLVNVEITHDNIGHTIIAAFPAQLHDELTMLDCTIAIVQIVLPLYPVCIESIEAFRNNIDGISYGIRVVYP